jgi:mono/diheme cytochrome c family protein
MRRHIGRTPTPGSHAPALARAGAAIALAALLVLSGRVATAAFYGLGQPATEKQITGWDIDVAPDGRGLPPRSGTPAQGEHLYAQACASCHGAAGQGGVGDRLVGGRGTLATARPVKTVGSYWPYATTLFDYIRRAMPLTAPESLTNDQVYALAAYILYLNGIIGRDAVIDARTLPQVRMPNRGRFTGDPRPDVP